MAENDQPPAPPAAQDTSSAPAPAPQPDIAAAPAPPSPAAAEKKDDAPEAPAAAAPELLPTIRDHAERLALELWQVNAIIARLHGAHDDKGTRVFEHGVSLTTRMSDEDFDQAADVALHGRI